ncbi:MAG: YiiX/YebB-like N1pC/P60 family cysteine hydrolase [Polyangiales bacterium]
MRFVLFAAVVVGLVVLYASGAAERAWEERAEALGLEVRPGDVVLQDLRCGERCAAIRAVTRSRYTHVGVVLEEEGELVVWEALAPVGPTPLGEWARRGRLAVYRPPLDETTYPRFADAVRAYAGRPYDGSYLWDDGRIYCSELVAKAWRDAFGEALVEPRPVSLGAWASRAATLTNGELVDGTPMVSPADLVRSGRLVKLVDELE